MHVTRRGAAILALLYARDAILTQHLMDGLDGGQLLALSDALDAVSAVLDVRLTSIDTTIDTGEEH